MTGVTGTIEGRTLTGQGWIVGPNAARCPEQPTWKVR